MPYKPPKMTPKAASRERSKLHANARMRTTLRTPRNDVRDTVGMSPLGLPVRAGAATLSTLAAMTGSKRYGVGRQYTNTNVKRLATEIKNRKNKSRFNLEPNSPLAKKIKAYDSAILSKNRVREPSTNDQYRDKLIASFRTRQVKAPSPSASKPAPREWTKAEWRQAIRDAKKTTSVKRPQRSVSGNVRKFKEDVTAYEKYLKNTRAKQADEKAQRAARRTAVKKTVARRKRA